jgi:hypothetical protein
MMLYYVGDPIEYVGDPIEYVGDPIEYVDDPIECVGDPILCMPLQLKKLYYDKKNMMRTVAPTAAYTN